MRAIIVASLLAFAKADCGWTSSCGPRGCPDCKDDASAGYRECCGAPTPGGCGWTSTCGPRGCLDCKDDGSAGYNACCGSGPPPPPTPPTPPGPPPAGLTAYCPSASDFVIDYGDNDVTLEDQGWTVKAKGRVGTAAAYNMLGGSVEFDFDVSGTHRGVNANIYTISPTISGSKYHISDYCDGSLPDDGTVPWCPEIDWIESNGNCGGATTLHTKKQKGGNDGCTTWGCRAEYQYNGKTSFHVKVTYGTDGTWTTIRDGQVIDAGTMNPHPDGNAWASLKQFYESKGAVVVSSEWTGWVPVEDACGGNANDAELAASHFSVKNLRIVGSIVQGPTPRKCIGQSLSANDTVVV